MIIPPIETRFKSGTQAVEAGRKGGSVSSPAKSLAATLRNLERSKRISNDTKEWLYNMMCSDEMSSFQVLRYLGAVMGEAKDFKDKKEVARLLLDWKKMRHGTRETRHEVDVTTKEFKFIIEAKVDEIKPSSVEANEEATGSVQLLTGPINN